MYDPDRDEYRFDTVEERIDELWDEYERTGDPHPLVLILDRVLVPGLRGHVPPLSPELLERIQAAALCRALHDCRCSAYRCHRAI